MPDSLSFIRAKTFRKQLTPSEAKLWSRLRAGRLDGYKFRRQHPVGPYILDFYCAAARLAVEIDGAVHATEEQAAHDERRTRWLAGGGVRVVRLRVSDVMNDMAGVLGFLSAAVRERVGYR